MCGGTHRTPRVKRGKAGLSPRVRGNRARQYGVAHAARSIPACAGEPPARRSHHRLRQVYPRVCGGTSTCSTASIGPSGLSPRVRGNRRRIALARRPWRSIPACAGEPCPPACATQSPGVYPRVCGGTRGRSARCGDWGGLSPRVRGNPRWYQDAGKPGRSIPACAGEPGAGIIPAPQGQVYPRVCGGTGDPDEQGGVIQGLSPRVRGNRDGGAGWRSRRGSIPACAGEPALASRGTPATGVYPRVCGGTVLVEDGGADDSGLSPRVRGNRGWSQGLQMQLRSIPACAGEPQERSDRSGDGRVYPRVCGGTSGARRRRAIRQGLSPRVRGNPRARAHGDDVSRSIPACAGEPPRRGRAQELGRVYPRVCGGTSSEDAGTSAGRGLSPRVRGNPFPASSSLAWMGSIPACAGEPGGWRTTAPYRAVYPRVCGGTDGSLGARAGDKGLSPRVRGNLGDVGGAVRRQGSIPACAGEPCRNARGRLDGRVYPRVCGGTTVQRKATQMQLGLSPRVRGNRTRRYRIAYVEGSIPACAGEPVPVALYIRLRRVYPRVCGGTYPYHPLGEGKDGLSPRVRGNL